MAEPIIKVAGLTKRFGTFVAVNALSIRVPAGTIYAFLGANGSGKSTTIRMLIGLLQPSAGTIEVDGIDVIAHPRTVRDHIGYMGQKVSLYRGLSLRENVEFYAGLYNLSGQALERRWDEVRTRFELAEAENEMAEDLPAGVRQRAGLALATLHQPRILFLDEPTAGVDIHNRGLFWQLIREQSDAGVTVFVTTHFLEEADYCDWVSFIDAGRLIADAQPEELRQRFSPGYVVNVGVADSTRPRVEAELRTASIDAVRSADGFRWETALLLPATLDLLSRLQREYAAVVTVEQPAMTEIFRRVLEQTRSPARVGGGCGP